ncbi:Sugar or nucleoside kinase, ribokinase family [Caldanaerobius fijiensis DSM 17918]|uniref:Sugar or nucleoside kinase, ribokinase family n=1 Tax=Caldanaerobius fijiensis DSM 17918 TaxID=1121256 RepID=A0A1M4YM74_9THEO|nr:carbohydrate kinase family protein [Caldanaerobius fijiensis]SHF06753.1 Sugar or nucleoside kinase, ribokinase family [Caldanaerobius fijiensis DSM 17918]
MENSRKIVVAGHICLDIIPRWVKGNLFDLVPGHLLEMDGISLSTGGVVSNTGIDLKKLGFDVLLLGKVGDDYFGKIVLDILRREGEEIVEGMIISPGETTSYSIVLNPPGTDRIFLHCPGANNTFSDGDIPYEKLKDAFIFHFGYPPLMRQFFIDDGVHLKNMFEKVKEMGVITSLDMAMPDPNTDAGKTDWIKVLENVLPYVDIFLPSIDELLYMIDRENFEKLNKATAKEEVITGDLLSNLSDKLLDMGSKINVIKLGNQGLYLRTSDKEAFKATALDKAIDVSLWSNKELMAPCFDAPVIGTTGSGDATIAGFLAAITQGTSPEMAIKIAIGVGSFSVGSIDATGGIRPLSEVLHRIREGWACMPLNISHEGWIHKDFYGDIFLKDFS